MLQSPSNGHTAILGHCLAIFLQEISPHAYLLLKLKSQVRLEVRKARTGHRWWDRWTKPCHGQGQVKNPRAKPADRHKSRRCHGLGMAMVFSCGYPARCYIVTGSIMFTWIHQT